MNDRVWRVVADFGEAGQVYDDERPGPAAAFAGEIADLVSEDEVSYHQARVFAYVRTRAEAISLRQSIEQRLQSDGSPAKVSIAQWDEQAGLWRKPDGTPEPGQGNRNVLRVRPGEPISIPRSRTEISFGDRRFVWTRERSSTRGHPIKLAVVAMLAAAGIAWYASAPGVASYTLGSLLVYPAFIWLLWRLRRLPARVKWTGAMILAVVGIAGYLIVGGSQWWYWGQFAIWPLVLLILGRGKPQLRPDGWYGGPMEGPWGPP